MKLTTKGRYGLRAVIQLALANGNTPVSIKSIAEQEAISPIFLEQIFYLLKKRGIIASVRGPGGGFVLNRPSSEITLKDILQAVGESIYIVPCTNKDCVGESCPRKEACKVSIIWQDFYNLIESFLMKVTLQDIITKAGTLEDTPDTSGAVAL
jgi:Rrf2 family iron-sulfur cluster assembly transcriptional regulator